MVMHVGSGLEHGYRSQSAHRARDLLELGSDMRPADTTLSSNLIKNQHAHDSIAEGTRAQRQVV
jgi:hypothetical protein